MLRLDDLPVGLQVNAAARCGLSRPEQNLTSSSAGCNGRMEISNRCSRFGEISLVSASFQDCILINDVDLGIVCNRAVAKGSTARVVYQGLFEDLLTSNGWGSYMWERLGRTLRSEHFGWRGKPWSPRHPRRLRECRLHLPLHPRNPQDSRAENFPAVGGVLYAAPAEPERRSCVDDAGSQSRMCCSKKRESQVSSTSLLRYLLYYCHGYVMKLGSPNSGTKH
jgi:hypothetical protein